MIEINLSSLHEPKTVHLYYRTYVCTHITGRKKRTKLKLLFKFCDDKRTFSSSPPLASCLKSPDTWGGEEEIFLFFPLHPRCQRSKNFCALSRDFCSLELTRKALSCCKGGWCPTRKKLEGFKQSVASSVWKRRKGWIIHYLTDPFFRMLMQSTRA